MNKLDKISREFTVKRGETNVIYKFTTFPFIFTAKPENKVVSSTIDYLREIFIHGVPDLSGCQSVTECPPLIIRTHKIKNDMVDHALAADYQNCGRGMHHRVQHRMLQFDPSTIAIEVPVFNEVQSGHIDILRIVRDKIQVLDFKPKAHKETKASSQVYRYMVLLASALHLPLACFEGYYFDDQNCYSLAL